MEELKPCPFCGGEATLLIDGKYGYYTFHHDGRAKCPAAYAHNADYATEAEAIEAWNTRAERTTRNADKYADAGFFICGNCGFGDGGIEMTPNYCPNCGAKVVD